MCWVAMLKIQVIPSHQLRPAFRCNATLAKLGQSSWCSFLQPNFRPILNSHDTTPGNSSRKELAQLDLGWTARLLIFWNCRAIQQQRPATSAKCPSHQNAGSACVVETEVIRGVLTKRKVTGGATHESFAVRFVVEEPISVGW